MNFTVFNQRKDIWRSILFLLLIIFSTRTVFAECDYVQRGPVSDFPEEYCTSYVCKTGMCSEGVEVYSCNNYELIYPYPGWGCYYQNYVCDTSCSGDGGGGPGGCTTTPPRNLSINRDYSPTPPEVQATWTPGTGGRRQAFVASSNAVAVQMNCAGFYRPECVIYEFSLPNGQTTYEADKGIFTEAGTVYQFKVLNVAAGSCSQSTTKPWLSSCTLTPGSSNLDINDTVALTMNIVDSLNVRRVEFSSNNPAVSLSPTSAGTTAFGEVFQTTATGLSGGTAEITATAILFNTEYGEWADCSATATITVSGLEQDAWWQAVGSDIHADSGGEFAGSGQLFRGLLFVIHQPKIFIPNRKRLLCTSITSLESRINPDHSQLAHILGENFQQLVVVNASEANHKFELMFARLPQEKVDPARLIFLGELIIFAEGGETVRRRARFGDCKRLSKGERGGEEIFGDRIGLPAFVHPAVGIGTQTEQVEIGQERFDLGFLDCLVPAVQSAHVTDGERGEDGHVGIIRFEIFVDELV